jgi:hypothetical protein
VEEQEVLKKQVQLKELEASKQYTSTLKGDIKQEKVVDKKLSVEAKIAFEKE